MGMVARTYATALVVSVVVGVGWGGVSIADSIASHDDRHFTGTTTSQVHVYGDTVEVMIDGNTHILADVDTRYQQHCGVFAAGWGEDGWEDAVGDRKLELVAQRLLPVGTKVEGYAANPESGMLAWNIHQIITGNGTKIEPISYLHLGPIASTPSVSKALVASGWGESWPWDDDTLAVDDPVVVREHAAVTAEETSAHDTPADKFCGDREREAEQEHEDDRERRHKHRLAAAALEKRRERADYADDGVCFCKYDDHGESPDRSNPNYDWSEDWIYHPEDHGSGGSGGGGGGYNVPGWACPTRWC
jgi:hypothetical protein